MKLIPIFVLAVLTLAGAHGESLGALIGASHDDQIIKVTGCEYIQSLSVSNNVTIVGAGGNATIDGSRLDGLLKIGDSKRRTTVTLKDLVIRNCTRLYNCANLIIENCRFIGSELDADDCTILVKNSSFTRSINGTKVGEGGAVSLYKVAGVFDHCAFVGNSAFRNGTWSGGSGGGLHIANSTVTLIEPLIASNVAAFGGGIGVVDSDLTM